MNTYTLIVLSGPEGGMEYSFSGQSTVGRSSECSITIDDPSLSRSHFTILPADGQLIINDLDSSNGTYIDGARLTKAQYAPGAIISAGNSEFTITERYSTASTSNSKSICTTAITRGSAISQLFSAHKQKVELETIYQVAEKLPLCTSLYSLGEAVLSPLSTMLQASGGSLFLYRGQRKLTEAFHFSPEGVTPIPLSNNLMQKMNESDINLVENYANGSQAIAAAMESQNQLLGVLYLYKHKRTPLWQEKDLTVVSALGDIAGPALSNLITRMKLAGERGRFHQTLRESAGIIGESPPVQEIVKKISKLSATMSAVLICGETGTGKELVARAIHYNSPQAGNPMVSINCAALSEDIAESELFGHIKGAFTGATSRRKGRFEQADGGTLFLDEIGELSPSIQGKLLRVLETGTFTPVGSDSTRSVRVRIICATNRSLVDEVNEGSFRKDLFFRLNGFEMHLPPLRERKEDIEPLCQFFIRKTASQMGLKRTPELSREAFTALLNWCWPGNIRELANVIERAVVLGESQIIEQEDLPPEITATIPESVSGAVRTVPQESSESRESGFEDLSLEACEAQHIQDVLSLVSWNKKKAAELLGIERATLYKKIRKYGLSESPKSG